MVEAQTEFRKLSLDEALATAKKENKLVFVDFFTTWCAPCMMMTKVEFPKPAVGEFMNKTFVCIQINGEQGEGPKLVEEFGVTGYPTMFVLKPDGKKVMVLHSYTDGKELVRLLKNKLDPDKSLPRLLERYAAGENDQEFISLICEQLVKSEGIQDMKTIKDNEIKAHDIAQKYFVSLPDSDKVKQENQFVIWQYSKYPEDPAIQYIKANMDSFNPMYQVGFRRQVDVTYEKNIMYYFTGQKPFEQKAYDKYKEEFADMQLFQKIENSDVLFEFIDCYSKGDIDAYIDFCATNMNKLNKKQTHQLLMNYNNLLIDATKEQKEHAISMLRNQLPTLDTQSMYYVTTIVKGFSK